MNINVDSHFVIGKSHFRQNKPCQDHATSSEVDGIGTIVVSDGCSDGGQTDIGARVITCAANSALGEQIALGFDPTDAHVPVVLREKILAKAEAGQSVLGLLPNDLTATCIYAIAGDSGGFVHVLGDGCVILKYADETIEMYTFNWRFNMPYYLIYTGKSLQQFIQKHATEENGEQSVLITRSILSEKEITSTETFLSAQEAVAGYVIPITPEMIDRGLELVAIASDGIETFRKNSELIETLDIAQDLVVFKNWKGEFVKRRLSRALLSFSKEGIYHDDDIAYAVIHFENSKSEENVTDESS